MNPLISIERTTAKHIGELALNMRAEDKLEAERLGYVPYRLLFASYRGSAFCRTGLYNSVVASIWGIYGNPLGNVGCPWFITSEALRHTVDPIEVARIYKKELGVMREMYPLLENWVDSTYNDSIRLLRIVGFNLDDPAPHGKNGALFRRFWLQT